MILSRVKGYTRKLILRRKIIEYYKKNPQKVNSEMESVLKYISKNKLEVFNYDFISKYINQKNTIYHDNELQLYYIVENKKKMYFRRGMSKKMINEYYNGICMEQDEESPHVYLDEELRHKKYRVALDVGVAEGNFALSIIDQVEKIYLFEADELWIEALEATFEPYKDKVQIINKYVSNEDNDREVRLDTYLNNNKSIDLIKMDIEGAEISALNGSKKILENNPNIDLLICTYHKENDEEKIKSILNTYEIDLRRGYMVFMYDNDIKEPYFRKGVLKANAKK